jgi:hypothetical protein
MKINKTTSIKLAKKYKINLDIIDIDEWHYGLNVELEHGSKLGKLTNITNNSLDMTCKIAISHLIESPRYYRFLRKLEEREDKYWSNKKKPNIFVE